MTVPPSLRTWFVVHFVADVVFALPLFVAPRRFLGFLGWSSVDPISTRLVAAALFGIGIQSLLGRHESAETFRGMLNLKIIWSATATIGILWSQVDGWPLLGWAFAGIFGAFNVVWSYYRWRLRRHAPREPGVGTPTRAG